MNRHPKSNRPIWNKPICVDDFGNDVYICFYTGKYVHTDNFRFIGPRIPQATGTYVCSSDAESDFRKSKYLFNEIDRNCNTCVYFKRIPHDKNKGGFVKGICSLRPATMIYRENEEYWVHHDDCMNMPCYKQRESKV